jgi:deazaflavin-dependent oxidoreductase (nitroreductase family)
VHEDVILALERGDSPDFTDRTIDITTIGRRTGEPRRIEICFYRCGGSTYLSGRPAPRTRDWLLNLKADPHVTFHFKRDVVADLPAVATVITDHAERRRVLTDIVERFNRQAEPSSQWSLEEWVESSPLAEVHFVDSD